MIEWTPMLVAHVLEYDLDSEEHGEELYDADILAAEYGWYSISEPDQLSAVRKWFEPYATKIKAWHENYHVLEEAVRQADSDFEVVAVGYCADTCNVMLHQCLMLPEPPFGPVLEARKRSITARGAFSRVALGYMTDAELTGALSIKEEANGSKDS